MGTELDLWDVCATSELAQEEYLDLHNKLRATEINLKTLQPKLVACEAALSTAESELDTLKRRLEMHENNAVSYECNCVSCGCTFLGEKEQRECLKCLVGERDALREELRKAQEQEPVAEICSDATLRWVGSEPVVNIFNRHNLKIGDKLYASPVPAQKDYKIEDNHILFLAEKFMPSAFLTTENKQILWFAKACIDADQPISQPLIYDDRS